MSARMLREAGDPLDFFNGAATLLGCFGNIHENSVCVVIAGMKLQGRLEWLQASSLLPAQLRIQATCVWNKGPSGSSSAALRMDHCGLEVTHANLSDCQWMKGDARVGIEPSPARPEAAACSEKYDFFQPGRDLESLFPLSQRRIKHT